MSKISIYFIKTILNNIFEGNVHFHSSVRVSVSYRFGLERPSYCLILDHRSAHHCLIAIFNTPSKAMSNEL